MNGVNTGSTTARSPTPLEVFPQLCSMYSEKYNANSFEQDCVNHFCNGQPIGFGSCSEDFPTAGACCQQADPASCLRNFQLTLGVDHDGACATVRSELAKCESISGFATIAPQDQASCLCYNNIGNYIPSVWDNAASSCWASGSSAHPYLFSLLTAISSEALGFCTVYAGPNAASATTTGTASVSTTVANSAAAASTTTSFTTAIATSSTSSSSTATATASKSSGTQVSYDPSSLVRIGRC